MTAGKWPPRGDAYTTGVNGYKIIPGIVGDAAYPASPVMRTPFKGAQGDASSFYNYCLSSQRMVVEHTIGILKNRFLALNHVNGAMRIEEESTVSPQHPYCWACGAYVSVECFR